MSSPPETPVFLQDAEPLPPRVAARHLKVLQELIHQDSLAHARWDQALRDLVRSIKRALGATEAMVALYDARTERWSAMTSQGCEVSEADIARFGSRAVLEQVRATGEPILSTEELPLGLASPSIMEHRLESVLAVPLFWWDLADRASERYFAGCIYAHRTSQDEAFTYRDVVLVLDMAALVQPVLNLLRRLQDLETSLEVSQEALKDLRRVANREFRLGQCETCDPWFAEHVIAPLAGVAHAANVSMLLLGPTGSGKSHLAQSYHLACARKGGPFVVLDCSQVTSAETLAAELFGYAPRSGYANAPLNGRPGKAQLADGGTLFIDEISSLPPELQQRLLRLIQTGRFSPLGSAEEQQVDLQILAASHRDLRRDVQEGLFREDLFWRLAEIIIELPPLSRRTADIPIFARRFLEQARTRYGRGDVAELTPRAMAALVKHDWARAGNLRGLEHTLNRTVLLAPAGLEQIDVQHLLLETILPGSGSQPPVGSRSSPRRGASPGAGMREPSGGGGVREASPGAGVRGASPGAGVRGASPGPGSRGPSPGAGSRGPSPTGGPASQPHDAAPEPSSRKGPEPLPDLETVKAAILQYGSGSRAARALGVSRGTLIWQLRRVGLTIGDILPE